MGKPSCVIGHKDIHHDCQTPYRMKGSRNVFLHGIGWSRMGDVNTPHLLTAQVCPTHAAPIQTGSPTVFVNNVGAGRVGDAITACTQVAEGSPNVFCGP